MSGEGRAKLRDGRWYVAQVKPRQEKLAMSHLDRQGFLTHCPQVSRSRLVMKKPVIVREPLFPGYVFVQLGGDQQWRSINGTIGVLRLVTFGSAPAPVPSGFVERLREFEDEDGHVAFQEDFQPGDSVRVVGGPFDDLCGSLAVVSGGERVVVLMKLLSGDTRVTISRAQLVAA